MAKQKGPAKVVPLRTLEERRQVTTLAEAMSEAIEVFRGKARVKDVVKFVTTYYGFRQWKPKTMASYFYAMSKPQRFARLERGLYENTGWGRNHRARTVKDRVLSRPAAKIRAA